MSHIAARVNDEQKEAHKKPSTRSKTGSYLPQQIKYSTASPEDVADNFPDYKHERESRRREATKWFSWKNFTAGVFWKGSADATKHWKPVTLQGYILGGFVAFSVAIIIILEVLANLSSGNGNSSGGGLVFAVDVNRIPAITSFAYLYLPTVLAVIYSMLWSWVDLDTKRLEPWFQLSKADGAMAEDSLLLQYPFDFLPFVPLTAFRRKHWGVFFAGSTMLIIFWVITPLQSAVFSTGVVSRSFPVHMGTSAALLPIESQTTALNANFLNLAYGISWLNQTLPAYTTNEFAAFPFRPVSDVDDALPTETWKTTAGTYRTNLTCEPAISVSRPLGYTFDNGNGCSVSGIALPDLPPSETDVNRQLDKYLLLYIGYHSDAQVDYSIANPNCTDEHSNNFLAIFASASSRTSLGIYSNLTALFCIPTYEVQEMAITVNSSSGAVVGAEEVSDRSLNIESLDSIFNKTIFEYILGAGVNPVTDTRASPTIRRQTDFPDLSVIEQYPRVKSSRVLWPLSNMVGFAIGLNQLPIQDLTDSAKLQHFFEKAHQLLFTTAFGTLTRPNLFGDLRDHRPGFREDKPGAIILVREIGIIVEVAFGIVAALAMTLWYISRRRISNLGSDPASISNVMSMTSYRGPLSESITDDGTVTMTTLETTLCNRKYRLLTTEKSLIHIQPLANSPLLFESASALSRRSDGELSQRAFKPVRPFEHHFTVAAVFASIILIALAALVFLQRWDSTHRGIPLPSNNSIVRSIIENYAPTAFATFLEPVWIILSRLLCLLQPFEELRKGNAISSKSVEVKYTSLPPQLTIWRALRARHFVLAAVCFITVSTNVLAVTLAALLNEQPTTVDMPFLTSQTMLAQFNRTSEIIGFTPVGSPPITYRDHFYVALSNITAGNPLPPWYGSKYFYIPFHLKSTASLQRPDAVLRDFQGSTFGIGAAVTCIELPFEGDSDRVQFNMSPDGAALRFSTSYPLLNGTQGTCKKFGLRPLGGGDGGPLAFTPFGSGANAMEIVEQMVPSAGTEDDVFCKSQLVVGWARVGAVADGATTANRSIEKTFLGCRQRLRVAKFDVVVDINGRVISSTRTGNFSDDTSQYFRGNATEISLFESTTALVAVNGFGTFSWHNDTFTADWINSLVGLKQNSTSLVDPEAPLPNATAIAPLVEALYEQLFVNIVGLNADAMLSKANDPIEIVAQARFIVTKLFVSPIMFATSVVILSLHLVTVILYYTNRPKRFLPRMPTSIASIIAYVSTSRALEDFDGQGTRRRGKEKHTYGYGRFIGTDGKTHVGIERQRYVIPLKSRNPDVMRRRRRGKNKDESEPKIWI